MHVPRHLLLQWHITNRCNQRCLHCYQEKYSDDSEFELLLHIVQQLASLLQQFDDPVRGHVTVTGGEPFLHDRFLDLLELFAQKRKLFSFAILTNGSLLDDDLAKVLRRLNPAFVQVSLEGKPETHDRIRGRGNYERTVNAVRMLVQHGVRTYISFTAHQGNFQELPHVAEEARRLGVARLWADRLIPHGQGAVYEPQLLTVDEHRNFLALMDKERKKKRWFFWRSKTDIAMHRALQFLVAGGRPYHCAAGDSLITVMPNGDLYPCRRMPILVGNLQETPLTALYQHSALFQQLRNRSSIPAGCAPCLYKHLCRGGLKCLAYAVAGDPFAGDPGCWIRNQCS